MNCQEKQARGPGREGLALLILGIAADSLAPAMRKQKSFSVLQPATGLGLSPEGKKNILERGNGWLPCMREILWRKLGCALSAC